MGMQSISSRYPDDACDDVNEFCADDQPKDVMLTGFFYP
jgi:hypothetical protein